MSTDLNRVSAASTSAHGASARSRRPCPDRPAAVPLERIIDALPVGLAVEDAQGAPVYANRLARTYDADLSDVEVEGRRLKRRRHVVSVGGDPYAVAVFEDVTEQQSLEDELFRRAFFDELTGLPNRALIERSVENLVRDSNSQTSFALAFIDVDNFKHINDYYGHDAGDQLLIKIASRIGETARDTDMLARLGGDELLLLVSPLETTSLNERLGLVLERLKEPFFIDGHEIFSSASIGVSLFPLHGRDFSVLRINADNAMYRIKGGTKGGMRIFDPQIGHAATERVKLEQRLRTVIRDRRLCCAFQPKVDFRSGSVTGVEVLLRWRDEIGVIQAPGDFVNLAVELGLMDDITLEVLRQTVGMTDRIDALFGASASISINVAAKQANDVRFMRVFAEALVATGNPQRFMVELTEEAFIAKTQFQLHVLPMLRDIGTRVSIDDFGVGFSSLSALADITADEIKVDRSFITDIHKRPRNQSIIAAIESLGRALGMSIVLEGVETLDELTYLQGATSIRIAQGYYFARPVMLDEDPLGTRAGWRERLPTASREPEVNRSRHNRAAQRS